MDSLSGVQGIVIGHVEYPSTKQCHAEIEWGRTSIKKRVMTRLTTGEELKEDLPCPDSLQHPNNLIKEE